MILISHAIAGAALGQLQKSIPAAFLIGFISHFFLDMVPHYEYSVERFVKNARSRESLRDYLKTFIDAGLGTILSFLIFWPSNFSDVLVLFAGIFGALLPDALQGVYHLFPVKILGFSSELHKKLHSRIGMDNHPLLGIFSQVLVCGILIAVGKWF